MTRKQYYLCRCEKLTFHMNTFNVFQTSNLDVLILVFKIKVAPI